MNRKKLPTVVACVVLAAMLLFSGVYAGVEAGWFSIGNNGGVPAVSSGQETPPPPSSSAQEDLPSMYRFVNTAAGEFLPKPDVFEDEEGRTITTDRFRFTVDAVYVAKDTQGLPYPANLLHGTVDENGTLISEHSYFFMDITLENRTNLAFVNLDLTWLEPVFYAGDMKLDMNTASLIALQSINNDVPVKSRLLYTLQPNATVHYTVAYVVEDEQIAEVTDVFALFSTQSVYCNDGDLLAWQPWVTFINMTPLWQAWKE